MTRLLRWIRGDIQILGWLKDKSLNKLSKYKIIDNLRRGIIPITIMLNLIVLSIIKIFTKTNIMAYILISIFSLVISSIIDILNYIIFRKENIKVQKKFTKRIDGLTASVYRGTIEILTLPYKSFAALVSIIKTIYRMLVSKEHLLEWITAEEAEKLSQGDLKSMYKNMILNPIFGIAGLVFLNFIEIGIVSKVFIIVLLIMWVAAPFIMFYISKPKSEKTGIEKINAEEKEYIIQIARRTWDFFAEYMNEENNFLPPDNFQESRKENIVNRTSSTNIGLRTSYYNFCLRFKVHRFRRSNIKIGEIIRYYRKVRKMEWTFI